MATSRLAEIERIAAEEDATVAETPINDEKDALIIAYRRLRDEGQKRVQRAVRIQTESTEVITSELASNDPERRQAVEDFVRRMVGLEADHLSVLEGHFERFEISSAGTRDLYAYMPADRVLRLQEAEHETRRAMQRRLESQRGVISFYQGWVDRLSLDPPDPWPPEDRND